MRTRLIITDLDNTIYDWISSFVPAFYGMVEEASYILDVSEDELLDGLRKVHQRHGNSEHPFALLETHIVRERFSRDTEDEARKVLDPAFHKFNKIRRDLLKPYEGVVSTLQKLDHANITVVAHTDARIQNSLFRLVKLNLVGLIKELYAPVHSNDVEADEMNIVAEAHRDFVRLLPATDRKPNPKLIFDICNRYHVSKSEVLYVGDSLSRDVLMAKRAGVWAAWARYGTVYEPELWPRLVRITHWTNEDVEADIALRKLAKGILPDLTFDSFEDILKICEI